VIARDLAQVLFFALLVRPFLALFIGLRVRGRENLPGEGPFVLVANHQSHLDTVSLLALFPLRALRRLRPVAAADYFSRTRRRAFVSRTFFNILPIARSGISRENNPIDAMAAALARGETLLLFPEGTRGGTGEPGHFKAGVAHLVERAPGVPVVPAHLVNMGRSLPKGEWIPLPIFCEIRIGPALRPEGSREAIVEQLERAVRALAES
jgi:1-acyl-sn-glycerol-3-phosphate acyltransferase